MNKNLKKSFLNLIFLNYTELIRFNLKEDNFETLIQKDINFINTFYKWKNLLYINWNKFIVKVKSQRYLEMISNEELFLFHLLQLERLTDIKISNYVLDKDFIKEINNFISLIKCDYEKKDNNILKYINSFDSSIIRNISLYYYYWVWTDDYIFKSITYLNSLIDEFPKISTFYLMRIRQKFNYVYRIYIKKENFNKLVTTTRWLKYLWNNKYIIDCLKDFKIVEKLTPNYSTFYLYKWKFLLHFLNKTWIKLLFKALEINWLLFDFEVYAWLTVYYLQIWNYKKAKFYIFNSLDNEWDRAKYIGKLIYYYILSWNKVDFIKFIKDNDIFLVLLSNNKAYTYDLNNNMFVHNVSFKDTLDLFYRTWFYLNNFDNILSKKYLSEQECLDIVFNNISRKYYDHWNTINNSKVVFYSRNNFLDFKLN